MKKQLVALALISGLALTGTASANWGHGSGGSGGCGNSSMMRGQMLQQLDPAIQEKVQQFFKDNQALRKEMAMKRAVQKALMQSQTPDTAEIAKVTGELFDLRMTMREKAEAAGVDQYVGTGRKGFGRHGGGNGMR
jgi:Spy/CpxP family protein refolding chaperone